MEGLSNSDIERLLEDISKIKSVINKNKPLLKQIYLPASLRLVALLLGASVIIFSLVYHFLIQTYSAYNNIPQLYRIGVLAAIVLDMAFILGLKAVKILGTVSKSDKTITLLKVYKLALSFSLRHVTVPVLSLILFFCIFLTINVGPYYIIPVFAIGMGIITNFIGCMVVIKPFIILGYWQIITGVAVLIVAVSPMVAVSVTMGCGYLLFALVSFFDKDDDSKG